MASPRQRCIHEECVEETESPIRSMHMSKDMEHRPYPAHSGDKLLASRVVVGIGSLVKDAKGRPMGDKNVGIGRDLRV